MPTYRRSKNRKLVRKSRKFTKPYQIVHFLATANEEEFKPFRDKAREYLSGQDSPPVPLQKEVLQRIATEHPKKLIPHAVSDFNLNNAKGGGMASGIAVLYKQLAHLLGMDKLKDAIFGVDKQKPQSLDSTYAAYLVDQTYSDPTDRPSKVLNKFTRLTQYDSNHISVWQDASTGELTVAVRGSRSQKSDIMEDIGILVGNTNPNSSELDGILDRLERDYPNTKYDVACHSLGAMYVNSEREEHGKFWDHVYMFNPGSSPMQSDSYEREMGNNELYSYYMNHGDPISANLLEHMSHDTLQNQTTFGDYSYSPMGSHSITQWFPKDLAEHPEQYAQAPPETWLTPYEYKPEDHKPEAHVETWLTPYEYKGEAPEKQEAPQKGLS